MVINTPYGNSGPRIDGYEIRSAAVAMNIPCVTTVQGASAAVQGIEAGIRGDIGVMSLQELHTTLSAAVAVPGFGARLADGDPTTRAAVPGHRSPSRAAPRRGGCRETPTGSPDSATSASTAFAGFAVVKPQVAFFEAYGSAGYAVLERTHRRTARGRRAGARRRQARRHRLDDGRLRRRLGGRLAAGRRRRHRVAVPRVRVAVPAAGHRRRPPARRVRAGRDVEPGGRRRAAGRDRTAAPWRSRSSTPPRPSTATRCPSPARSAWSSARPRSTSPTSARLGGPVLVPGVGAQGGRAESAGRSRWRAAGSAAARGVARGAAGRPGRRRTAGGRGADARRGRLSGAAMNAYDVAAPTVRQKRDERGRDTPSAAHGYWQFPALLRSARRSEATKAVPHSESSALLGTP